MKKKLDNYSWREALDRAAMIEGIFNEYVVGHPVVEAKLSTMKSNYLGQHQSDAMRASFFLSWLL